MSKSEDKFPRQERILGRYTGQAAEDRAKIARIVMEVGEPVPVTVLNATAGGDERKLRGIPAIARGVAGAIPGTSPHTIR